MGILGYLGIRKIDRRFILAALGGLIGLAAGLLLRASFWIVPLWNGIDFIFEKLLYLAFIDIVGFILCGGGLCRGYLFRLPYIYTIPLSLLIYGCLIGFFIGRYSNKIKMREVSTLDSNVKSQKIFSTILIFLILLISFIVLGLPVISSYKIREKEIQKAEEQKEKYEASYTILKSVLSGTLGDDTCSIIPLYKELCYVVTAMRTGDNSNCLNLYDQNERNLCENLLEEVKSSRLSTNSCDTDKLSGANRLSGGNEHLNCYFYVGVYFQNYSLCKKSTDTESCEAILSK